jgi:hypothetical protein
MAAYEFDTDMYLLRMYELAGLILPQYSETSSMQWMSRRGKEFCRKVARTPQPLVVLSRRAVSEAIGVRPGRIAAITALHVAPAVWDFLLFDDLDPLANELRPREDMFDNPDSLLRTRTDSSRRMTLEMRQIKLSKPKDPYWDSDFDPEVDEDPDGAYEAMQDNPEGVRARDEFINMHCSGHGEGRTTKVKVATAARMLMMLMVAVMVLLPMMVMVMLLLVVMVMLILMVMLPVMVLLMVMVLLTVMVMLVLTVMVMNRIWGKLQQEKRRRMG